MADTTFNPEIIIERWSTEIKKLYQEYLMANQMVRWVDGDFPDGDKLYIPTFSEMNVRSYTEGDEVILDDANTGEFTLQIDKYYQSGFKVTDKLKRDSFYTNQFISHYSEMLFRAIMEKKELEIFELQSSQTAGNANTIDGAAHRKGGGGTSGAIILDDFNAAKYAFTKSNVPRNKWIAILDPATTYEMTRIDNIFRQDVYGANSHIKDGLSMSVYLGRYGGFECYESNMLDTDSGSTSIDGTISVTNPVYNMFCGAGETFIGAMRHNLELKSWRDDNRYSDVFHATAEWGLDLFRPEALFVLGTPSSI